MSFDLGYSLDATSPERTVNAGSFTRDNWSLRTALRLVVPYFKVTGAASSVSTDIVPLGLRGEPMLGSTDVGDVSWKVPLVQADGATIAIGTPFHSWQLTAQGKSPLAKKGMVHVAKVMAGTAIDALSDPGLIERAKADLAERTRDNPYISPLPATLQPPVQAR